MGTVRERRFCCDMKLTLHFTGITPGMGSTEHSGVHSQQTIYTTLQREDIIRQISGTSASHKREMDNAAPSKKEGMSPKSNHKGNRTGEEGGGAFHLKFKSIKEIRYLCVSFPVQVSELFDLVPRFLLVSDEILENVRPARVSRFRIRTLSCLHPSPTS